MQAEISLFEKTHTLLQMRREKNLFSDTCEASCLAAASLCAEESAAYVRDVYRLPGEKVAASEAKRVELEGVLRRMVAEAGGVLG